MNNTTRLSTKGQIVLPLSVRTSRAWVPGTEFVLEETAEGILLRPVEPFAAVSLDQVVGCLGSKGKAKSLKQMDDSIRREVVRRHDRGRY